MILSEIYLSEAWTFMNCIDTDKDMNTDMVSTTIIAYDISKKQPYGCISLSKKL